MCPQLSEPAERLSGSEREEEREEDEDEDDAEAALKKEVGQIRACTERQLRRFQSVESGANNVVFIRTRGIGGCAVQSRAVPCRAVQSCATQARGFSWGARAAKKAGGILCRISNSAASGTGR